MRRARILCFMWLVSCSTTCGSEELAELAARVGGEVERDQGKTQGRWHSADLGTRFSVGDGLRTGAHSSAELALLPSGAAHVAPHSLVRFLATPPERPSHQVVLEAGELEVLAEQIDLEIHTPRAVARVSQGSKLRMSMRDGRARFDLIVGRVVVTYAGGKRVLEPSRPLELNAATGLVPATQSVLDAGAAVVGLVPDGSIPDALDAEAEALPATLARSAEQADAGPRPSASGAASLRLRAIESAMLHVGTPPVEVSLPIASVCAEAALRVDGQPVALAGGEATASLATGTHRIAVACVGGEKRLISLVVKRDAARLELPKRAQNVRVEADGRHYTVRYQNLPPDLNFAWPGEAETGAFTLLVRSEQRELSYAIARPEHLLSGTALGEGEHKFWFRDANGRSSKPSTLRLAFDNTARSAYLSLPVDDNPVNGPDVQVAGAALVASKVSIEETSVKLDAQGRFNTQVTLAPGRKAITVRVEHPGSGVHYYLRRLR
jgi:hypothetical protein